MINPILPFRFFFSTPDSEDIDGWSIYNSNADKVQKFYNSLCLDFLKNLYFNKKMIINCCITGESLDVHSDYPIIDGIFVFSKKKISQLNYIKLSNNKYLYPISSSSLYYNNIIKNRCKLGRIYGDLILMKWCNKKGIKRILKDLYKKNDSVKKIQNFYRTVIKNKVEWVELDLEEDKEDIGVNNCVIV